MEEKDFFSLYLDYTAATECPTFFHRWTAVTSLGAYLGRNIYFRHGHFTLYPNLYAMLIGSPGTKKSSAIKIGAKLLKTAGYDTFAAKKTRQEKFLLDMAERNEDPDEIAANILDENLWGDTDVSSRPPSECFVAADEFNNFIGVGNLEFMSILGELWDYEGIYDYKLKNSKSIFINDPTVSILGGNTPTGFSQAFPVDAIGQGFFSRLLLIYGEPSGVKFTFPPPPDRHLEAQLVELLHKIKTTMIGEVTIDEEGIALLEKIYHSWSGIPDVRFEHYTNRRLTHLLKLCLVICGARCSMLMTKKDIIYANTLLTFTEGLMPKALGEFGKGKHSEVNHKIMQLLDYHIAKGESVTTREIWKHIHTDLERREQMIEILGNLQMAGKIDSVEGGAWIPIKEVQKEALNEALDWSILTDTERNLR